MKILRFVTDDDLREALDHPPPGIIDPRSWAHCGTPTLAPVHPDASA